MLRTAKLTVLRNFVNSAKSAQLSKARRLQTRQQGSSPYLYASRRCLSLLSRNRSPLQSSKRVAAVTKKPTASTYKQSPLFVLSRHHFSNLPEHEIVGLPALSPSVETSKIVEWKKKEGDFLEANEAIAVVQTDKAEIDWELTDDAYLAKILLQAGETVPVGTPACIFVDNEADIAAFANYDPSSAGSSSSAPSEPAPAAAAPSEPAPSQPAAPSGGGGGSGLPANLPEYTVEGLPALSPTATDGAIVEWLVQVGDMVEEGSGIAEIQTDKSVVTWAATDEAYIAKLLHPVGPDNKLPVGTPLAVLVESKDDIAAFASIPDSAFSETGAAGGGAEDAPPTPAPAAAAAEAAPSTQAGASQGGRTPSIQFRYGVRAPASASSASATSGAKRGKNERIIASPYAKSVARELGVDLSLIESGSGSRGRITASDVEAAAKAQKAKQASAPAAGAAADKGKASKPSAAVSFDVVSSDRSFEDIPMTVMREVIAKRLSESKFTSPHYYTTFEFEIDNLLRTRAEMNDGEESKVSINDFLIKACALALKEVPMANVSWHDNYMRRYNYVDISVAVATPTGLITPIVKDADLKGLKQISAEVKDLAKRAKNNKLLPAEFQGGTFTISNLGMFGVKQFTAIINPPQSCILAVGGGNQILKPDSSAKGFRTATTMITTLSSDHRSVDGALSAEYMSALKKYVENPAKMLL